ncbi:MAG: formyltransferase family protein, partial [Alphaproteobacteria bacterium]
EEILAVPGRGALNIHGSLLPKYRGRCPLNWAIIHGETETGATLHHMIKKADAGDIVDQIAFPIGVNDVAGKVMEGIQAASVQLLRRHLDALKTGTAPRKPLDISLGAYFGGRSAKDGIIDWQLPSQAIHNLIRSQLPYPQYPGATTTYRGKPLRILGSRVVSITCDGLPGQITSLQPLRVGRLEITDYQWIDGEEKLALGEVFV